MCALTVVAAAGISTDGKRGYHLLGHAAHVGVTCIGPQKGNEQTFVLLEEWAPNSRRLEGDEALTELALRYFRSHGPADRHDFARWTALTLSDKDLAIEGAKDTLTMVAVNGSPSFMSTEVGDNASEAGDMLLLPIRRVRPSATSFTTRVAAWLSPR